MKYQNITKDDIKNGDGLRVVLWISGCDHKCPGCQNPITWDCNDGLEFDQSAKEELFDQLNNDYISGITFSGGDPLYKSNREEIYKLALEIKDKYPNKTIWLYTGYTFEYLEKEFKCILDTIDVLVDGIFLKDKFDSKLLWKGSSNQRVIDVRETLLNKKVVLLYNNYSK